jgi:CBS domain-containing protein
MLASDLQTSLPMVNRRTSALVAGRLLTHGHVSDLVVADDDGRPVGSISGADLLPLLVSAGESGEAVLGDLIDHRRTKLGPLLRADPDDGAHDLAEKMADAGAQFAVVAGPDGHDRFVSLPAVMNALLALHGDSRDLD